MKDITLEELLEAGCHFGHQVTRGNPKARDFIFEARDGIHIIDLVKTKEGLDNAAAFVKSVAQKPGSIMVIVGTKRQAHAIVEEEAKRAHEEIKDAAAKNELLYVTNKWIGGLLTNFGEVSKNFKKLADLETKLHSDEEKAKYTKKEVGMWEKERQGLESLYGGIHSLQKQPDVIFIVDSHLEHLAVDEATKMGVPTVAMVDTNADPNIVDYPIPANDDAVGSVKIITGHIVDAWIEGKNSQKVEKPKEEEKPKEKKSTAKTKEKKDGGSKSNKKS